MSIKIIIFLVGLTIVVTALSFGVNTFLDQKPALPKTQVPQKQTKEQSTGTQKKGISLTGLEIAQKTAQFLESALKADNIIVWNYKCDKRNAGKCIDLDEPPSANYVAFLSSLDLYKKTPDEKYKALSDKIAQAFLKGCLSDINFCEVGVLPLSIYYQQTQDNKYKDAFLKVADKFLKEESLYIHVQQNHGPKLAALYQATQDKKYLDKLKTNADNLLAGALDDHPKNRIFYKEGNLAFREMSLQIIWADYLPAYQITGDKRYLIKAKEFFDQSKILDHFELFKERNAVTFTVYAIDSLLILGEADNPSYTASAQELAQKILVLLWDNPENKKSNGDYGWLRHFTGQVEGQVQIKSFVFNDWMMKLFVKMADQSFSI